MVLPKKMSPGAVFLDVPKAFDKIWHNELLFKLFKCKFPIYLIQLLASYLIKVFWHNTQMTKPLCLAQDQFASS